MPMLWSALQLRPRSGDRSMMSESRSSLVAVLALLFLSVLPVRAASDSLGGRGANGWCGTHEWGIEEALARHDWNRRRLAREPAARASSQSLRPQSGPSIRPAGNVAVIEDDGTIIADKNVLDFEDQGVRFRRKGTAGFKVKRLGGSVSSTLGEKLGLGDDDSTEVDLPGFKIRFYGQSYDSVFVNSDGNLTFGEPEHASTSRDIQRLLNGPPRVAPFFADLDPSVARDDGGVYIRYAGNKLIVTWWKVPEFGQSTGNTFQLTVAAKGTVDVRFEAMAAKEGIVGVAPGGGGGLALIDLSRDPPLRRNGVAIAERFTDGETLDEASVAQVFFQRFADDYDQLVMFTDFGYLAAEGAIAYHLTVKNGVKGIGKAVYDGSRFFGSRGRLGGFVNMGGQAKYASNVGKVTFFDAYSGLDVVGHELGHQWLVGVTFVDSAGQVSADLLGRGNSHWNFYFDSDLSFLEGNEIRDNGDGTFTTLARRASYNSLDLYLMGLVPAEEVPDKFYVDFASGGPDANESPVEAGLTFIGSRVDVSMDRILASLGPRKPSVQSSPKEFKVGFILLAKRGQKASGSSIQKVQTFAAEIEGLFRESTQRLATVDTTLITR
jgi:hypothetical protein